MADQLSLLEPSAGRHELWFRAVDLLGRRVADVPVHECPGGWAEAERWCYLAVAQINGAIRFAWEIESRFALSDGRGAAQGLRRPHPPCCAEGPIDRHFLAHLVAHCA